MTITLSDVEQKRIFANNLRDALNRSGKQQIEVARAIGVSQQTFNTWCRGIALPRMGKLERLANYFGVKKSELIDTPSIKGTKTRPTLKVVQKSPRVFLVSDGETFTVSTPVIKNSIDDKILVEVAQLSKEGKKEVLRYIEYIRTKEKS